MFETSLLLLGCILRTSKRADDRELGNLVTASALTILFSKVEV